MTAGSHPSKSSKSKRGTTSHKPKTKKHHEATPESSEWQVPQETWAPTAPEPVVSPSSSVADATPTAGWAIVPSPPAPTPEATSTVTTPAPAWSQVITTEGTAAAQSTAASSWTTRGLPWLSALGWALFVLGLALPAYTYQWSADHEGATYALSGISGLYLAAALLVVGLALGIVFSFVPRAVPTPWSPNVTTEWLQAQMARLQQRSKLFRILTYVGLGLMVVGFTFASYVFNRKVQFGGDTFNLATLTFDYATWAGIGFALAGAGLVLGLVFHFRIAGYREAARAAQAAAERVPETSTTGPTEALPGGIHPDQVQSLMRRIDAMLANLPDEVVTEFSKSPEAETYLKILSGKP